MIRTSQLDMRWLGPLCGLLAAVGYTATNICLRSVTDVDSAFVAFVRGIPTLFLVLPFVLLRTYRGQALIAPKSHVFWLVVTGVFTQIFGNVLFQWSLGIIGLALSVPLVFGSMIIGSALIGAWILKEPLNKTTCAAILLLLVAVTVLTLGAQRSSGSVSLSSAQAGMVTLAVLGNMISGFAYSALGTVMRRGMKAGMSIDFTLLILAMVGLVSLGSWSMGRLGPSYMANLDISDYLIMLSAGGLNALSFYCLATALQRLNVVYVHIINASQAAMAALAGVMIFAEPLTAYLVLGISLTAAGLTLPAYSSLSSVRKKKTAEDASVLDPVIPVGELLVEKTS